MDALAPFVVANMTQSVDVLPYLRHDDPYNFDIKLSVAIQGKCCQSFQVIVTSQSCFTGQDMKEPGVVCQSNFKVNELVTPHCRSHLHEHSACCSVTLHRNIKNFNFAL